MAKHYRRMRPLLGTFVEVGVASSSKRAEVAVNEAFRAIEKINRLLSFHNSESDLSKLNSSDGSPQTLNPLTIKLLRIARNFTRKSENLFNCTIGGKLVRDGFLPNHNGTRFLDIGDADDIEIKKNTARLRRPVLVSLDGIAKGYAVDLAVQVLKKHGFASGWVNAGGDMRVFGKITIPIHRREREGSFSFLGYLNNSALATSSATKSVNPSFPGKIFSPKLKQAASGIWTVTAETAWLADALTKVAFLAPTKIRNATVSRLGGTLLTRPRLAQ